MVEYNKDIYCEVCGDTGVDLLKAHSNNCPQVIDGSFVCFSCCMKCVLFTACELVEEKGWR